MNEINLNEAKIIKSLPADMIMDAVIIELVYYDNPADKHPKLALGKDGSVDKTKKLVEVITECKYDERVYKNSTIFSFYKKDDGLIYIGEKSALAKFKKKYNEMPKVGLRVKQKTNSEGFFKLLID